MCVIAVKPKNVELPSDEYIQNMWDTNKDGAGFMYTKDNKVVISKGFMVFEDFKRALDTLKQEVDLVETPLIMHFRITTHGGTSPENTHPFPISENKEHLRALDLTCNLAMAHNGVISSVPREDDMSDTQIYVRDIVTPLAKLESEMSFLEKYKTLISTTISTSRLAFLDNKGNISTFGNFTEENGVLYSNMLFKPYVPYSFSTFGQKSKTSQKQYSKAKTYRNRYSSKYENEFKAYEHFKIDPMMSKYSKIYAHIDEDDLLMLIEEPKENETMLTFYSYKKNDYFDVSKWYVIKIEDDKEVDELIIKILGDDYSKDADKVIKDEEKKEIINNSHNIGGRKNQETKDIRMTGDRTKLQQKTLKKAIISQFKIGEKLFHRVDGTENVYKEFVVKSSSWFFVKDVGIFYKTKDGTHIFVDELVAKQDNEVYGSFILRNLRFYTQLKNYKEVKTVV